MQPRKNKFEETINILFEELKLAIQWNRPSILLAIHKSEPSQYKAKTALENKLKPIGKTIIDIEVNSESSDVAHLILRTGVDADKKIFFVSNIDWGRDENRKDAYRSLNLYREIFVENKIKAVFWLTVNEAINLPKYAPDFWAFRHCVVEFASIHGYKKINPAVGILIWHIQASGDSADQVKEKISSRESMLVALPDRPESLYSRIELLYELGYLFWTLGNTHKSKDLLIVGMGLVRDNEFSNIRLRILNGLAIIHYEMEEYLKAYEIYENIMKSNPQDGLFWINLSAVLCALGKNSAAASQGRKATKIDPTNAKIWNSLGYINMSMGKPDEAVACFKKAIEFAPARAAYHESLAICFSRMGLIDKALEQTNLAHNLMGNQGPYSEIYEEVVRGRPERALSILKVAVEIGQISKVDIRHDPNINLILDRSNT